MKQVSWSHLRSLDVGSDTNGCGYNFLEVLIVSPYETMCLSEYWGAVYFLKHCSDYVIVIRTVYLGLLTRNKSLCLNSLWDFESSIYYILVEIKLFFRGEVLKLYLGLVKIILHCHTV